MADPRFLRLINLTSSHETKQSVPLQVGGDHSLFLLDKDSNVWDWRDPRGNWTNRAILENAYSHFILTKAQEFWRPAFLKFNQLMYNDISRKSVSETYFLKVVSSLKKALDSFEDSLEGPLFVLYKQLKTETTHECVDAILKLLLLDEKFRVDFVDQFYFEFTFTDPGPQFAKLILPSPSDEKDSLTDEKIAELYQQSQPAELYGPKADPALRGREKRDEKEVSKCSAGRPGFKAFDGYTPVEAPYRQQRHFSAAVFFKIMPEEKSCYIREMHQRGFNVNAGPSGTMGRIQLMLKIFREYGQLSEGDSRRITLAIAADFVRRGQHTFIECMQACQAKPLENMNSCFGLFTRPGDLLISDPRTLYEKFFLSELKDSAAFQALNHGCDDLFQPKDRSLFSEHRLLPAV